MRVYKIKVLMDDGLCILLYGLYASDWDAIDAASSAHGNARLITPRRIMP